MPQKKETDKAGDIRRSQMVQIYGPGAIVNLRYNNVTISTVMADLHMWEYKKTANNEKTRDQKFTDARLSKRINAEIIYKKLYKPSTHIKQFWLPPVVPDDLENKETRKPHLQSKIFPETLICPECRRVDYISSNYWGRIEYDVRRYCQQCSNYKRKKVYLVPSRFITCCEAGHLEEFNYRSWLEFRTGKKDKCKHQNIFLNQRAGLGLASLILSCNDCKALRVWMVFSIKMFLKACLAMVISHGWLIQEMMIKKNHVNHSLELSKEIVIQFGEERQLVHSQFPHGMKF